jgi:Xaa-Pro aminopeptidase
MEKLAKLREQFAKNGIDGMLVTSTFNRRYLTNFTGTAGVALISGEKALFITDFRYVEQASKQAEGFEIIQHQGILLDEIAAQAEKLGIKKLGFEETAVTYSAFTQYQKTIKSELVPVSNLIETLRLIKTESEIKLIKLAADIADAAYKHILSFIKPGMTELEVSNELEFFMRRSGAASSSFDTIVASGTRSALPHGVASEKVIEKGDFVTLDYGALYKGYVSDITRTVAVGEPSAKLKEIYNIVLESQLLAVKTLKPGMSGIEADEVSRKYISDHGYGEYFGHSLGHGIGLEVHEGPSLSVRSEFVLEPNMIVTIEPGIYLPGVGGVRIEDDAIITHDSNELLTHSTKELIIL